MTRQLPLLDDTQGPILSPQFRPRPGWGGQLGAWLKNNYGLLIFRLVLLVALIWIALLIFDKPKSPATVITTPTPSTSSGQVERVITAARGEGLSQLSARALDEYLKDHPETRLTPLEHLWAVTQLWHSVTAISTRPHPQQIDPGDSIAFPDRVLESVSEQAKALSPSQRQHLLPYLR